MKKHILKKLIYVVPTCLILTALFSVAVFAESGEKSRFDAGPLIFRAVVCLAIGFLFALGITREQYGELYAFGTYNMANKYDGDWTGDGNCELFVDDLRQTVPDIELTTDVIVGFPGETDRDFQDTLSLMEEVGYAAAFTFKYSPRKGTRAAEAEDQVPEAVKKARSAEMIALGEEMSDAFRKGFLGRTAEILTEEPDPSHPGFFTGYTREYIRASVEAKAPGEIISGTLRREERQFLLIIKDLPL